MKQGFQATLNVLQFLFTDKVVPMSGKRSDGPRAIMKTKRCREIAQWKILKEREEVMEKHNASLHDKIESTTQSSQVFSMKRLVRPSCLDVYSERDLRTFADKKRNNSNEAVTFWSHELMAGNKAHFPATLLKRGSPFARCASFSNDIEDSRLRHSGDDDLALASEDIDGDTCPGITKT